MCDMPTKIATQIPTLLQDAGNKLTNWRMAIEN